jgi:hypothetical protein
MRVLFDQGVPVSLPRELRPHNVSTLFERGWSTLENGKLLDAAEGDGFEALVTTDQNIKYQQNLAGRRIAVVVLTSTAWPKIQGRIAEIASALAAAKPGTFTEVSV